MYYKIIDKLSGKTLAEDSSSLYALMKAMNEIHTVSWITTGSIDDIKFLNEFCTFQDEVYTLDWGKHYHCSFPSSVNNYFKIGQNLMQQYFNCIISDPAFHDLKIEIIEG